MSRRLPSEAQTLYETLDLHPNGKLCWVVYRCSYADDSEWARFVQRLYDWVRCRLGKERDGNLIINHFEFDVRDDKEKFDGASMSAIRRDFNDWVEKTNGSYKVTMHTNCIYADAEVIESVLNGPDPNSGAPRIDVDRTAWVKILEGLCKDEVDQFDEDEISDDEERAKVNSGDEGFEPINGCRLHDLGWIKVAASNLISGAYYCLNNGGWYAYYVRPPFIISG
ncbi:hypothetical protein CB0940_10341 [Cercospora beticola]|uniref:Uncharacterized protein n=1 Tax=Cercospora beticola TaxID=122368 RepID=A0A2G5HUF7_CERBT|nr:hypothetical protein CB0940_10341 [Cercospora beticola]PIA96184.1 hypothetical protein CB0940_10341 [Cercospora beticola]WPB07055.1 hypothetical protein RHO25_011715 [Cercospora beticola]CAK1367000.1 unnamed protein product [Cercospora beticola]